MKIRLILALLALVGIPVLFTMASSFVPKRYTAVAKILISSPTMTRMDSGPLAVLDDLSNFSAARSAKTQIDVITGTEVLRDAIANTRRRLPEKFKNSGDTNTLYGELIRRLAVDSEKESDVLFVRVTNTDPEVAAEYANQIVYAYIAFTRNLAKEGANASLSAMRSQLTSTRTRLKDIDREIVELKRKGQAPDLQAKSAAESNDLVMTQARLAEVTGQYEGAVKELAIAKAQLAQIPPRITNAIRTENNPVYTQLEIQLNAATLELAELRTKYQDDFPDVVQARRKVNEINAQLKRTRQRVGGGSDQVPNPMYMQQLSAVSTLDGKVSNLREQMENLRARAATAEERTRAATDIEQRLNELARDKNVLEQNYQQIEQRREITEGIKSARQSQARQVSVAIPPSLDAPSFPDPRIFTLAGLALGIFTAVFLLMPRANETLATRRLVNDMTDDPVVEPVERESLKMRTDGANGGGAATEIVPKDEP